MKARMIKTIPEAVIIYKAGDNLNGIKKIADRLGMKTIIAADSQAGEQVGFLAGYVGFDSNGSCEEIDEECLIFSAVTSKKLDSFLSELRKNGIFIPYKAVVTASNRSWTLGNLITELIKEREQLGG